MCIYYKLFRKFYHNNSSNLVTMHYIVNNKIQNVKVPIYNKKSNFKY